LIGIGINVGQTGFVGELSSRATSLAVAGLQVDRIAILEALLPALDRHLGSGEAAAIEAFRRRDMLRGRVVRIRTSAGPVEGIVESIDPLVSITVRTASGVREIDASTARIESFT
jgi:BirA family biotin operon repressor/biotin-[acetyl-CoA-carboxylase] ligase